MTASTPTKDLILHAMDRLTTLEGMEESVINNPNVSPETVTELMDHQKLLKSIHFLLSAMTDYNHHSRRMVLSILRDIEEMEETVKGWVIPPT
jgi:hypothetical protein